MASYTSPWVINFANSNVGVGVLAMPFVFEKCGIILAILMILVTTYLTKKTCEFILKASLTTRKPTFEQIGLYLYGDFGKLMIELGVIGLLIGTLVAYQVVMGDLAPAIVSGNLGIERTWSLRTLLMIVSACAILPLTLMRNISSLAGLNMLSISFYVIFVIVICIKALPAFVSLHWVSQVNMWNVGAILQTIPIVIMAFTCQMQVLVMYAAVPDPSSHKMIDIVNKAINLVSGIYICTGVFGYVAFYTEGGSIAGNVMENFPPGLLADFIKFGFWLSVIISFPLIAFPVRSAINSLIFSKKKVGVLQDVISSASDYIAPRVFTYISFGLVFGTVVTGILIPKIEVVLSVTGSLVGTFLCFVVPAMFYLHSGTNDGQKKLAQFIFLISFLCTVFSTMSVVSSVVMTDNTPVSANNAKIKIVPDQMISDIRKIPRFTEKRNDAVADDNMRYNKDQDNLKVAPLHLKDTGKEVPNQVKFPTPPPNTSPKSSERKVNTPQSNKKATETKKTTTTLKKLKIENQIEGGKGVPKNDNVLLRAAKVSEKQTTTSPVLKSEKH